MADPYYIDLERFSLARFRHILETKDVLPGRKILKENLSERFGILESNGIGNLQQLTDVLKTKDRIERFSQQSGLPEDYLVILRREAYSYVPKPVNLRDIPEVDSEYIEKLASVGIKNTKHLFDRGKSERDRTELSRQTGVPSEDLLALVKMSDLARIGGVGPVFARLLYEAGADTVEKFVRRSPDELLESLHAINNKKGYTKIMPTLKDVQYCIETARELPIVVED